jgi:hypothetical protein
MNTDVTWPGAPVGTTATPGTVANACATLMYWPLSRSSLVRTVEEVAVVSMGCALRVAAVTSMVGSCFTVAAGGAAEGVGLSWTPDFETGGVDFATGPVVVVLELDMGVMDWPQAGADKNEMKARSANKGKLFRRINAVKMNMGCFLDRCGRPGPRFSEDGTRAGTKKPSLIPQGETKAETGRESTAKTFSLPSCPWRDSRPDHTARDLMSAQKAGLLTSGSSYSFRLTALAHSGLVELSSPVTAALPHRICTCFPILPGPWTGALSGVRPRGFKARDAVKEPMRG